MRGWQQRCAACLGRTTKGGQSKKGFSFPPKKEEERRLSRHGEKKEAGKVRTYKHVYLLLITNGLYMDVPNP